MIVLMPIMMIMITMTMMIMITMTMMKNSEHFLDICIWERGVTCEASLGLQCLPVITETGDKSLVITWCSSTPFKVRK